MKNLHEIYRQSADYDLVEQSVGGAKITVFGKAIGSDESKKIGGVPATLLRREVVDKMVEEDGWLVNDYYRRVNGKVVYLVVAQCPINGEIQARLFFFTEVDGKIYNLSATARKDAVEKTVEDSERVIEALQRRKTVIGLK